MKRSLEFHSHTAPVTPYSRTRSNSQTNGDNSPISNTLHVPVAIQPGDPNIHKRAMSLDHTQLAASRSLGASSYVSSKPLPVPAQSQAPAVSASPSSAFSPPASSLFNLLSKQVLSQKKKQFFLPACSQQRSHRNSSYAHEYHFCNLPSKFTSTVYFINILWIATHSKKKKKEEKTIHGGF